MNELQKRITNIIKDTLNHKKLLFSEIIDLLSEFKYRDILLSWGILREQGILKIDEEGFYYIE